MKPWGVGAPWIVRRELWDRAGTELRSCVDTILSDERVDSIFDRIATIHVPLSASGAFGTDGTIYRLEVQTGMTSASWNWWGSLPAAWEPLSEVIALFD